MTAITKTHKWLEKVVIGLNLCPFAKIPFEKKIIRISNSNAIKDEEMLDFFIDELALIELNHRLDLSTTLIVFKNYEKTFVEFNEFSGQCDDFLLTHALNYTYQIVVFHPNFYFKDSNPNDIGNFVGQSPYPTIHILRNDDIDDAINSYDKIDLIPERNKKKLKRVSVAKLKELKNY